jgi:hypothetical protein
LGLEDRLRWKEEDGKEWNIGVRFEEEENGWVGRRIDLKKRKKR